MENPSLGIPVPLPPFYEADRMTQFMVEYLCRFLDVKGFEIDISGMVSENWRPTPPEES